MHNWTKWIWPAIITTALLTILAAWNAAPRIAGELASNGDGNLSTAGYDWASLKLDARDATLSGTAPTPEDADAAVSQIQNIYGVRIVSNDTDLLPEQSPYVFSATKEGDKIILEGYAPNDKLKSDLAASTAKLFDGAGIENKLDLARGQSQEFENAANFAITQLSGLTKGKAELSDASISISGLAIDDASHSTITNALQNNLPAGFTLGSVNITEPEPEPKPEPIPEAEVKGFESWTLSRIDNNVTLAGDVGSQKIADANVQQAKLGFGSDVVIVDKQNLAENAPQVYAELMKTAINLASRMTNAKVEIKGQTFELSGKAYSQTAARAIQEKIANNLPSGFSGNASVGAQEITDDLLVEVDLCQALFDNVMSANKILFESGKSNLRVLSSGVLDRLAFAGRRCPEARLQVAGHTDSDGADDFNQILSESRAQSVGKFLQENGIEAARVEVFGLGETQPVSDNATPEGKAKNRRIEFRIIK